METQIPDETLPVQRVQGARRQGSARRPVVRELVSERDKTHGILRPTITSVQLATDETKSRNPVYSSIFEVKQATQTDRTDAAANPFQEHKVPKSNEWGSAPSRGRDDVYKGKDEERLFDGRGRVTVPSGLSKVAGGKKDDEDEEAEGGLDGGGGDGGDDGNDGGVKNDDELAGYVDAEDDEAWFEDNDLGNGEVLFRGDYQRRLNEHLEQLAQFVDEWTEKEDNDWLDKLGAVAKSLLFNDKALPHRFEGLSPMLRYQQSRRISRFQQSPTLVHIERFMAKFDTRRHESVESQQLCRIYKDVIKHRDLIFGPNSLMARQIGILSSIEGATLGHSNTTYTALDPNPL